MPRTVIFYKSYFLEFYQTLEHKTQEKIDFLLLILQEQDQIPQKYVKHLTNSDGIYELRISLGSNEYRILFFFESGSLIDGGRIVVLGNGFRKKDNRDYRKAIEQAEKIRQEYFQDLNNPNDDENRNNE